MIDKTNAHTEAANATARSRKSALVLIIGAIVLVALVVGVWFFNGSKIPSYVGYPLEGDEKEQVIEQNSPLTDFVYLTANADYPRDQPISKITIHHMGGDLALGNLGERFQKRDIQASSNYAIDSKGNVALYVEEANRAWTSQNRENDEQAITIEVANDEEGGNWHVSNETFDKLVLLCADICKRNGIEEIVYTGDTTGNLTFHGMFDSTTECPGPYLKSRMNDLADAINAELAKSE
ncbi:MAG: N-acetylmuramoyl-L-alanine amidase [Eggerthella sp.]|nr:N-acetylmuramoyl-L-alanine amidase [Eggerthella sp.]